MEPEDVKANSVGVWGCGVVNVVDDENNEDDVVGVKSDAVVNGNDVDTNIVVGVLMFVVVYSE